MYDAIASGNHVEWDVIDILPFRDDRAITHWGVMDLAGAMAQMSAQPNQPRQRDAATQSGRAGYLPSSAS